MKTAFIDTNIIFYAFGREHPLKARCRDLMKKASSGELAAVTNAEVLQEILYVHWRRNDLERGGELFDAVQGLLQEVYPVDMETMREAKSLLDKYPGIPPRDAVHAATAIINGIPLIITADRHFAAIKEIKARILA